MPEKTPKAYRLAGGMVVGILMLTALLSVHGLYHYQKDLIEAQQAREKRTIVNSLISQPYDNELVSDTLHWQTEEYFGRSQSFTIYRARRQGMPVGVVLMPLRANGYNGAVRLAIGINAEGNVTGIRILAHTETPGLGAGIHQARSNWLHQFQGRSLTNPQRDEWRLKPDDGRFDSLGGATVSSRAVVNIVRSALEFYAANREKLYQ